MDKGSGGQSGKQRRRILQGLAVAGILAGAVGVVRWGLRPAPPVIDTAAVVGETAPEGGDGLRVAVAAMVSPERAAHYYADLMQLIGARLNRPVTMVQRKTYAEVNALLEKREIDFAFVCSGAYVDGRERFGMELLAVPVVHGAAVYHSYILAARDGTARSFDDLRGKRFAFTDPKSNTGALVPRYMLARRGETAQSFFADSFFTYSHDNSIHAVASGLADGAAVDSLIWEHMSAAGSADTVRTRIVEKSPPYGIPPVVIHPAADAGFKDRLRTLLLGLHRDAEAAVLLKNLAIDRFELGNDAMYDSVRQMERWLRDNPAAARR